MSSGSTLKQQDEDAAALVAADGDSPDDQSVHSAGGDVDDGSVGDAKENVAASGDGGAAAAVVTRAAPGSLVTGSSSSSASSGEDDDDEEEADGTKAKAATEEAAPEEAEAVQEEEEEEATPAIGHVSSDEEEEEEEEGGEEDDAADSGLFADVSSPVSSRWEALSRQPSATVASEPNDPAGRLPVAVQTAVVSGDPAADEEDDEEEDDDTVLAWMHRCLDYTAKTPSRVEIRSLMGPEGIMTVRRPVQSLPRLGGDGGVFAPRTGAVAWLEEEGSGRVDRLMQVVSRTDPDEERAMRLHKRRAGSDAAPVAQEEEEEEEGEEAASPAVWGVPSVVPRDAPCSVGLTGPVDMAAVRRSFRLMHWLTLASGGEVSGIGDTPPFAGSHCPVDMAKLALAVFDGERSRGSLLHACAVVQWSLQQDPDATATMACATEGAADTSAPPPVDAAEGEGLLTDSHLSLRSFDRFARLQEEAVLAGKPLTAAPNGSVASVQWATAEQAAHHGAPEAATRLVRMLPFLHERIVADTLLQLLQLDHRASAAGGAGDQAPAGGGPGAQMAALMLGTQPDRSGPGAVFKREQDEPDDASVRAMLDAFAAARLAERLVWHLAGYGVLPQGWRLPEETTPLQGQVPACALVVEPASAEGEGQEAAAAGAGDGSSTLSGRRLWPSASTVTEHVSNAADVLIQLMRAWQTQPGAKRAFGDLLSDAVLPLLLWAALGVDADEQQAVQAALAAEGGEQGASADGARSARRVDPARDARRRAAMRVLLEVMELSGPETIKANQDIQNVAGGFAEVLASLMAEPKENRLHSLHMKLVLPLASFGQPLIVSRIVHSHILSHTEEAAAVRGAGVAVTPAGLDRPASEDEPRMSPTSQRHPGHETPAPFGTFRLSLLQLLLALLRSDARLCAKRLTGPALQVSAGLTRVRFLETARLMGGGDPEAWDSGVVAPGSPTLSPVPRPPWAVPVGVHDQQPDDKAGSDRSNEWSGAWLWQCMLRWVEVYPQNSMLHGVVRSLLRLGLTLGVPGMPSAEGGGRSGGAGADTATAILQDLLERAAVTRWATRVWWSSMREPLRRAAQTHHAGASAEEASADKGPNTETGTEAGPSATDKPVAAAPAATTGSLPNLSAIPRVPTPRPRDRSDSLGLHSGLPSLTPVTPREHGGARFWGETGSALAGAGRAVGRGLSGAAHVALSVLTMVRLAAEASDRSSMLGRWVRHDPFVLLAVPYSVTLSRVIHTPLLGAAPESGQRQPNAKALRAMMLQAAGMPPEDDVGDDAMPAIKAGTPDPKLAVAVDGGRMLREEVAELAKGVASKESEEGRLAARRFVCLSGPISNGDEAVWALQCAEALTLRREACLRSIGLLPREASPLVSALDLGTMPLQLPGADEEDEAEEAAAHSRAPPTTPASAAGGGATPPRSTGPSGGSGRKKKRRGRRGGKKARDRTSSVGSSASSATSASAAGGAAATAASAATSGAGSSAAAGAASPAGLPSDLAPMRVPVACSLGSAIASEAGFRGVQPHHSWDEADAVSGHAERMLALWLQSALEDRTDAVEAAAAVAADAAPRQTTTEGDGDASEEGGPPRDGWANIARPPPATAAAEEPQAASPPTSPERADNSAAAEFLDEID